MIYTSRKPLAYSGVVKLGMVSGPATWDIVDEICLMLRFVGPLNREQMDELAEYRACNSWVRVQLPGRKEFRAEIIGYDKTDRSFCLSIRD